MDRVQRASNNYLARDLYGSQFGVTKQQEKTGPQFWNTNLTILTSNDNAAYRPSLLLLWESFDNVLVDGLNWVRSMND